MNTPTYPNTDMDDTREIVWLYLPTTGEQVPALKDTERFRDLIRGGWRPVNADDEVTQSDFETREGLDDESY